MGVHTLWFMPLTPIATKGRKGTLGSYYACASYTAINPEFGTAEDFKHLIGTAHEMGFKIILDWVANHTGCNHEWTMLHPDWYKKDASGDFKKPEGMDDIIELDFANPALRHAMREAMCWWVDEFDIDGFRCDLAFWVELSFWKETREELDKQKPLFWLGEFDPLDSPSYAEVFDTAYTWKWMHKTEEFYKKHLQLKELLTVLDSYQELMNENFFPLWFTSNHDENSWNGTEFEKYGEMAGLLTVFSCTWYGLPLVYSGQELPNKRRLKFFDKDEIEWKENNELHEFYKKLLVLRAENPALHSGYSESAPQILKTDRQHHILAYLRKKEKAEVIVLLNFSHTDQRVHFSDARVSGWFKNIFSGTLHTLAGDSVIEIKPWGYLVLEKII